MDSRGSPSGLIAGGVALLWLACGGEPVIEPPLPADTGGTDPALVTRFEATVAEVRERPRDASAWTRLGKVYQANGRLELAVDCYRQSLALAPEDAKTLYFLALTRERLGRADEAVADLRRVTELAPDYAPAHWRLGLWLLDAGNAVGARAAIERARELAPASRAAALALARVELQAARHEAAAALLEGHLAGEPEDGYARFLLGRAYSQLGRGADAERQLVLGRGAEPAWRDPWADEVEAERAGFRAERDAAIASLGPEPTRAVAAFERLRQQRPENVGLLINLGIGYRRTGQLDRSARALEEAVRLQPGRPLAHLHLAVTYGAMARRDGASDGSLVARALTHAERTIELKPGSPRGYAVRADLLAAAGRLDEGAQAFLRAAELDAEDPRWLLHAASLLTREGRWRQAIEPLERYLARVPDSVDALVLLGASQANSGRLAAAGATLERARSLAPDDARVLQAVEQLDRARAGRAK